MGDLSKHFNRSEFECRCNCGFDTVDAELIDILEEVRSHWGVPVRVNSAARCIKHNRSVGSTDSSQHVIGRAADIVVSGVDSKHVYDYLNKSYPGALGLGKYQTFTHIDTRIKKARWG